MITPTEIKKKAIRHYKNFLTSVLKRQSFFPLDIKDNKGKATMPLNELYPALKELTDNSKDKLGYGYRLTLKTVNTQHAGVVSMPDRIYFEHIQDYLKYIGKEQEFVAFRRLLSQTRKTVPVLLKWLGEHPTKGIQHTNIWGDLLKVAQYFIKNPRPNRYARTLPIEIAPTFIQQHQNILKELLDFVLPATALVATAHFEQRFGLKYDEPIFRLRLLSRNEVEGLPNYLTDISLPLHQFNQLTINAQRVFIVERKITFLAFPNVPNSIALWRKGFSLDWLPHLSGLKGKQLIYWGDISVASFQTLAAIRHHCPNTTTLLMNPPTFKTYQAFTITSKSPKAGNLEGLTDAEYQFVDELMQLSENNSLPQDRIRHRDLLLGIRGLAY